MIADEDAGLPAHLYTETGGAILDAVLDEAVRLYDYAGVARADKIIGRVSGAPATIAAAVDHLVSIGTLRVISRNGIQPRTTRVCRRP